MERPTIQIRPLMYYLHPHPKQTHKADTAQGYSVEFYSGGKYVEERGYGYGDAALMLTRIEEWMTTGTLGKS
jgi:hypothetical protein